MPSARHLRRVVVSMTTIPGRERSLRAAVASLLAQTRPPDQIRLYASRARPLPMYLGPYVDVIPCDDIGPLTKLSAAVDRELAGDDLIVTVDDDIVYEPSWLETLIAAADEHPGEAVGMSGWNVHRMLSSSHGGYEFVRPPARCDVLEGWSGAAYRRRFFDAHVLYPYAPELFRCVDDVWISGYLEARGIGRRVVCKPLAHEFDRTQLGLHNRSDFRELNRRAVLAAFTKVTR